MFLADQHTHSRSSPDGSASIGEMAAAARDAGLSALCITDHCDLLDFRGRPDLSFSWAGIEADLAEARSALPHVPIFMGLELGEPWEAPKFAAAVTAHPELDFVLGSVHNLPSALGGQDFYFVNYQSEADCYAVLDPYFDSLTGLAAMDCYDSLAHIIYPLRYMNTRDGNYASLDRYEDHLRRIFAILADKGKALEVNTCRGTTVEDWRWLLGLYRDCGGKYITLGSDAHRPEDVGKGLLDAARLLKETGFSKLTHYVKHQPRLTELY